MITAPTGTGKTYLACAQAHAAIRNGHTALCQRAPRMLDDLAIARGDGRSATSSMIRDDNRWNTIPASPSMSHVTHPAPLHQS
jgi:hypothetical protein